MPGGGPRHRSKDVEMKPRWKAKSLAQLSPITTDLDASSAILHACSSKLAPPPTAALTHDAFPDDVHGVPLP